MNRPLALLAAALVALAMSGCRTDLELVRYEKITAADKALAERAEALLAEAGATTTPAREYVNRLRGERYQAQLRQLAGREPAVRGNLTWPRQDIRQLCDKIDQGLNWPAMPRVRVPRAATPPTIDGKLSDAAWSQAVTFTSSHAYNATAASGPATTWKLLWDDRCLYVAWDCVDTDLQAIERPRDAAVWSDDCVEVYLLPTFAFRTYWEIDITPAGSIYDAIQCKDLNQWSGNHDPAQNVDGLQVGIDLRGTLNDHRDRDEGYTIEIAIPWDQVPGYTHAPPSPGHQLHIMLLRFNIDRGQKPRYYAFQPLLAWGHNIWNHAPMELLP